MPIKSLDRAVEYLLNNHLKVVTAESCTGGLVASTLADPPGSGKWLECAFVTYSPQAKIACLNVSQDTIDRFGLTSEEVACEMAEGALGAADANLALATTGVAGPAGGDDGEEVGTVCFSWAFAHRGQVMRFSETQKFDGDRSDVRNAATDYVLRRIPHYHLQLQV